MLQYFMFLEVALEPKKCNQWDLPMEANFHRMVGFMLQATSKRLLQQDALLKYYERLLAVPPAPHK